VVVYLLTIYIFPQNVPVNFFENRSMFRDDMDKSLRLNFLSHPVQQMHS